MIVVLTDGSNNRGNDPQTAAKQAADRGVRVFTIVRKHIDIASWFPADGGLLIAAAVALSLWWNRTQRMPAPARIVDH